MAYDMGVGAEAVSQLASVATAQDVGELFEYAIDHPVTLPRRRSAMLPIVNTDVSAEKVSLYNAGTLPRHPLHGVLFVNDTGLNLLQGPVTVFEGGTYAGDARMDDLPPDGERLLTYAIDQGVLVDPTLTKTENTILGVRIVRGVLEVQRRNVAEQTYALDNQSEDDRTIVIEHPIRQNWTLVEPAEPWKRTDQFYRFRVDVPAGEAGKFLVREQMVTTEGIAILDADLGTLNWYVRNGRLEDSVRQALERAVQLRDAMVATQRQIEELQRQIQTIEQDQQRMQANLRQLSASAADERELRQRYVGMLGEQETELQQKRQQITDLQQQLQQQLQQLEDFLRNLSVG